MEDKIEKASAGPNAACRQFDLDLEAHLEGEDRPAVLAHARECVYCSVVLSDLELIRTESGQMALEEPSARVWANVRATLDAEGVFRPRESGWYRWFGHLALQGRYAPVGALACLFVLGSALLFTPGNLRESFTADRVSGPEDVTVAAVLTATDQDNLLPTIQTIGEMEKSYQAREASLEPSLKGAYQKGLASLDSSIKECLDSVKREPENSLAREYLLAAYTRKAEVLASALEFGGR